MAAVLALTPYSLRFRPALAVEAVSLWLPPGRETPDGRLDADTTAENGYLAVTVSEALAGPQLAVCAGRQALAAAGWEPASVDLVAHAWTYHQGHDFWSPAHFVAHHLGARRATAIGLQQMCNGGVAGVEVAATRLLADPSVTRAVVTTGDRFAPPAFDRWRGDYGAVYGDSGTAVLLSRTPGPAPLRLLAIASVTAAELEGMHRGDDPFGAAPRPPVASKRTIKEFFATGGAPLFEEIAVQAVHAVLPAALAHAGLAGDDPRLRYVALPRLGRSVLDADYHAMIAAHTPAAVLELGRETGHLGAGDAAANLAVLHAGHMLDPGEYAVLLSVGAGFTWSATVVQAA